MATFRDLEHAGWTDKAQSYDDHFASITRQAIGPLLQSIGGIADKDLIDICCGTGDLAAAAVSKGARVVGVDFALPMIEIARRKVPGAMFKTDDAEALDIESTSFDAATCAFGLWHLAEPDAAICEANRILRSKGVYAYTTWLPPEEGWDMFDILMTAVKRHGTLDVDLPPAPPPFRFADKSEAKSVLESSGFEAIDVHKHEALWVGANGNQLLELLYKGIVRAPMLIEAQAPKARALIKEQIRSNAEAMSVDGEIRMRWPFLIVRAAKK